MNWALSPQAWGQPTTWYLPLALTLPLIFAGGMIKNSTMSSSMPEEESYRSSQSDMAIESSSWRSEGQDYQRWREPPPPRPNRWRSSSPQPSSTGTTRKNTELFPEYEPGDPAFYNSRTGEQEGQVKVFEFGR